jgi:hypothetical protein
MASGLYYLYLSRSARANLPIGIRAGQWGLTEDAVHRRLEWLTIAMTGLEILQGLEVGDHVLAASGGPQPRVKRGGWLDATIAEGWLLRVTEPYHNDSDLIWPASLNHPGERFPHRFGIELVDQFRAIAAAQVGAAGMDALHYSANIGGLPVPGAAAPPLIDEPGPLAQGESDDPAFLALDGDLDGSALVASRREQRKLRSLLFAGAATSRCSFCGRTLPIACLRTAHIKKRSKCNEDERRDTSNIARACTLGCDHLFELGYITIDDSGMIRRNTAQTTTPDLDATIAMLEGRKCSSHSPQSERYFGWHRLAVLA